MTSPPVATVGGGGGRVAIAVVLVAGHPARGPRLSRGPPPDMRIARGLYDAFGVFGTAIQENIGVLHTSSLKMVTKNPNAS